MNVEMGVQKKDEHGATLVNTGCSPSCTKRGALAGESESMSAEPVSRDGRVRRAIGRGTPWWLTLEP